MPIKVQCPGCAASINAPDAAVGKRVKCPKCQTPLMIPAAPEPDFEILDDEPQQAKPVVAKKAPVRSEVDEKADARPKAKRRRDDDEDATEERPRNRKKQTAKKTISPLLIVGIALGAVMVLGGGAFAVYQFVGKKDSAASTAPSNVPTVPRVGSLRPPVTTPVVEPPKVESPKWLSVTTDLYALIHVRSAAFSADGKSLATVQRLLDGGTPHYTLQTWDLSTGKETARFAEGSEIIQTPRFSPDGKSLAAFTHRGGTISIWKIAEPTAPPILIKRMAQQLANMRLLEFTANSAGLVYSEDTGVYRVNIADRTFVPIEGIEITKDSRFAYSPTDGTLVTSETTTLVVVDLEGGGPIRRFPEPKKANVYGIAYSGDGKTVAVSRYDEIELWDTAKWKSSGQVKADWGGKDGYLMNPALSHDGGVIAANGSIGRNRGVPTVILWTGAERTQSEVPNIRVDEFVYSRDGRSIAAIGRSQFQVLDAEKWTNRYPPPPGTMAFERERLQGNWTSVKSELDGKPSTQNVPAIISVAGDQLTGIGGKEMTLDIDPENHKWINLEFRSDRGDRVRLPALFEIDGDELKLCIPVAMPNQPTVRPTDFQTAGKAVGLYRAKRSAINDR